MDQESRESNSLLVELDRGLQSANIGDQSEAVVRFTNLFQRYPLPVLVDSACLKLSEAFRYCSNFIRIQICEVLERNQIHLNKIYNVDLFYRNIFTVTTSNDPIARSITLLTLGNIAPIVHGYKSIHHCISSSLDSTVECELNAAIASAASYVKYSSEFACNIYPKIVSIISSENTTNEVKIRALSVLDHGFYNAADSMDVRSFLIDVMSKTKLQKLVSTCLTLSTKISYTSLSHIRPQIELLIKTFLGEPRKAIQLNSLANLMFLAEKSPHIWESAHVIPMIDYLEKTIPSKNNSLRNFETDNLSRAILLIFCKLLTCKCNFISQEERTRIFRQCYKLALNNQNKSLCSIAFELLTVMSEEQSESKTDNMIEYQPTKQTVDILSAIKSFLLSAIEEAPIDCLDLKSSNQRSLAHYSSAKCIYRHIIRLCQLNPHYCEEVLKLVFDKLSSKKHLSKPLGPYITELMCAVNQSLTEPIVAPKQCWELIRAKSKEISETDLLNLSVFYFQTLRLEPNAQPADGLVDKVTTDHSLWFGFKVIRQAMRYGHYKMAGLICNQLYEQVSTDTTDFYFKCLRRICAAESTLVQTQNLDSNLRSAIPQYEESVSPLRACIVNSRTTSFQLQYLWLRIRCLQVHSSLRQSCEIYKSSPLSYSHLLSAVGVLRNNGSGFDVNLSKIGIIQQMLKTAKDFRYLAECYESLSAVSFDCDDRTSDYLYLLKCSCILIADAIDAIFQYGKNLPVLSKVCPKRSTFEHRNLEDTCIKLADLIRTEIVNPGISPSDESIEPFIALLKSFSDQLLQCPFIYPRYFFQCLQTTQIKLAITPQPSPTSGVITLMLNHNLVLKVEGLIQNLSKRRKVIRLISKILVSVTMSSSKSADNSFSWLAQSTAYPINNYFKTEFLIPMKWAGSFNVDVSVSIIDDQERTWNTGPTERINLNVS